MSSTRIYLATDHHIRHVTDPLARAGLERWILDFVAVNPRFTVDQAVVVARQLAQRWGIDIVSDESRRELLLQPVLYTEAEWLARGRVLNSGARPVQLPGSHHGRFNSYLAGDVSPAHGADESTRWPIVDALERSHFLRRPPHRLAPLYTEFAGVLSEYERSLLRHVWVLGAVIEWDEYPDYDTIGWICNGTGDRSRPPRPDMGTDEAFFRIMINPSPGDEDVLDVILGLLAQILALTVIGTWRGAPVTGTDDEVTYPGPLEIGLIVHATGRRLGLRRLRNRSVEDYLDGGAPGPAPEDVRWNLVFESVAELESLLRGDSLFRRSALRE